ncbi:acetoacetate metabolism regulatory protein AtoC (Ornithine/argininedecarboxylase inhibitor) (Ornithine decarboxylase antizyme) [Sulfurihydrogenibium azorense Az-Fu1]|uniref:Acetoacetate metabolism regulatory protein AtoC (Ornithine/argininedecarboxylase inhibitor) (Ornithine decarboxylase antizyme) n=1 Tax=Sulfurihydrogenibium azorense (strain DSM 15241 / OCM 825 / Az-Fu1) TaxID=204536 RepID=C1DXU0_SULAA|nr:sigma-54 dependent transcriptional regulator [Sulfurihydrogenibium azorense]ACN99000.1 acetoacetate metabolism regulatory protein AtoC (Ornithine/argininedecarboxylase inhibitor) (Ornithine decarboxylase antizyme) [Sulfurihydrogenibium azorense Az-Fu1]
MLNILVVDDEKNIQDLMKDILTDEGYYVGTTGSITTAKDFIKKNSYDVIFLDVWLPDGEGLDLLPFIKENSPNSSVVMISGHANIPIAVKAIKEGAFDFLEKPLSTETIMATIEKVEKQIKVKQSLEYFKEKEEKQIEIIGNSPKIVELKRQIEKVAKTNAWVMILGENGTGKELVAKSIHYQSPRKDYPFVDINCAAIPDELFEAEFFGYEKGAFTNAFTRKIGKLELADKGTLFLDEVADMSLSSQAKLLRVLEEKQFSRLGSNTKITVDLRVISATNKDIQKEVEKGTFRQDLAFRLSVIPIYVPPLREREEDILLLANYFLRKFSVENKVEPPILSDEVKNTFLNYNWPGNVRELKNLMERLVILNSESIIYNKDLPPHMLGNVKLEKEESIPITIRPLKDAKEELEKQMIKKALKVYNNNLKEIAKALDIDLSSLYRKIKQYNLEE